MFKEQAIEKLNKELKEFKSTNQNAGVIKNDVANTLKYFCEQDDEFAQAVVQNDKTLSDCCDSILKGVSKGISDLDAYKKAVKFYFSTADIKFNMSIDLCGNIDSAETSGKIIKLSLDDLFD